MPSAAYLTVHCKDMIERRSRTGWGSGERQGAGRAVSGLVQWLQLFWPTHVMITMAIPLYPYSQVSYE